MAERSLAPVARRTEGSALERKTAMEKVKRDRVERVPALRNG